MCEMPQRAGECANQNQSRKTEKRYRKKLHQSAKELQLGRRLICQWDNNSKHEVKATQNNNGWQRECPEFVAGLLNYGSLSVPMKPDRD